MLKDSRGFMWFGTQNGLNRYDGYSFTTYLNNNTPGSISGNYILDMCEDEQGNIWVGTENNYLCKYIKEKDNFEKYIINTTKTGNGQVGAKTILRTYKNDILVGTDRGLFILNQDLHTFSQWSLSGIENPLNTESITELFEDYDSTLWIGTNNGLFHVTQGLKSLQHFQYDSDDLSTISNNTINCIIRASNDSLYIGTNEGLNSTDGKTGHFKRYYYNPNNVFSSEKKRNSSNRGR